MSNQTYIAPHLREHIFRAYEDALKIAVDSWPTETAFAIPSDIATSTFLANFRNAVVSLTRYSWSTSVNFTKLQSMCYPRVFTIVLDPVTKKVHFRAARTPGVKTFTTSFERIERKVLQDYSPSPSLVPWKDTTDADLEALCLLIDKERLTGPFFIDGEIRPDFVARLQDIFNVALVYDAEKKITTIT